MRRKQNLKQNPFETHVAPPLSRWLSYDFLSIEVLAQAQIVHKPTFPTLLVQPLPATNTQVRHKTIQKQTQYFAKRIGAKLTQMRQVF